MIDLKALLALLVVGQLGLSTAGKRHRHHDGVTVTSDTRITESIIKNTVPNLLGYAEMEEDVETFKNFLIQHRDAPVPAGELPITNRKSHEVGQYILIVRNAFEKILAITNSTHSMIGPKRALEETLDESMSNYEEDYKVKIQPAIDAITHIQDDLKPIFKLVADLSKETDPSQQLAIYLKYEFDNKPYHLKLMHLQFHVAKFLNAVNKGPVSKEDVLVEEGAETYVKLNMWETALIAHDAWEVAKSDPNIHTPTSHDKIFEL